MSETRTCVPTKSEVFDSFMEMLRKPYSIVHIDEATRDGRGASASFGYEGTASIAAEISRLQSRIEELERVLKPFADGLTYLDQMGSMRKEYLASISCTGKFGEAELIRARSALEASNKGGK